VAEITVVALTLRLKDGLEIVLLETVIFMVGLYGRVNRG